MIRIAGLKESELEKCYRDNDRRHDEFSEEHRKKLSESAKKYTGSKHSMFGKKLTDETKAKISEKMKLKIGDKNGFFGRKHTDETKKKISIVKTGIHHTEETKKKIGKKSKELWQNPEWAKKTIKASYVRPTKPELIVGYLSDRITNESYLYTGDGRVVMGGRCPDFVNINGQKKIIELFGDYWHSEKVTGRTREQEEMQRIDHFAKYGWKTLVIWESELKNLEKLEKKIMEFHVS